MLFYIKQYGWKRNMIRIARISDIDAVLAVINDAKELLRRGNPCNGRTVIPTGKRYGKILKKNGFMLTKKKA